MASLFFGPKTNNEKKQMKSRNVNVNGAFMVNKTKDKKHKIDDNLTIKFSLHSEC